MVVMAEFNGEKLNRQAIQHGDWLYSKEDPRQKPTYDGSYFSSVM